MCLGENHVSGLIVLICVGEPYQVKLYECCSLVQIITSVALSNLTEVRIDTLPPCYILALSAGFNETNET